MKISVLAPAAAFAAALLMAGSASAEAVVAKLQKPVPAATKPVAGGAVFNCLGDVCAAASPGAETGTLRGCRDLVRQVGAVASYGPASSPLSSDRLETCNTAAAKR